MMLVVHMENFTLEEAKRWIGHTVIAKMDFNADRTQIGAEQQGTVIGVQGERTIQGEPIICLAVQFWPDKKGAIPNVIFATKQVFNEYLCLSRTV
jgi:hypothetical protein